MRVPKSRSAHLKLCNIAILCTKTGAISTVQGSRKGFELRQFVCFVQVGRVGFEPTRGVTSADFKSAASAVPPPSRPGDSRNRGLAESNGPLDRHCFTLVDIGCGPSWAYSPYQRVPYVASDHAAGHQAHEVEGPASVFSPRVRRARGLKRPNQPPAGWWRRAPWGSPGCAPDRVSVPQGATAVCVPPAAGAPGPAASPPRVPAGRGRQGARMRAGQHRQDLQPLWGQRMHHPSGSGIPRPVPVCRWQRSSRPSRPRSARAGVGPSRHYRPAGVDMQVHACI